MKYALATLLLASTAYAVEPYQVDVGLWTCPSGYVIRDGQCIESAAIRAESFEVSDLPSAGDGAPGTCPSGGCPQPAPRVSSAPVRWYDGWRYEGENPGGGDTWVRTVGGGRQVVIVPSWPW